MGYHGLRCQSKAMMEDRHGGTVWEEGGGLEPRSDVADLNGGKGRPRARWRSKTS